MRSLAWARWAHVSEGALYSALRRCADEGGHRAAVSRED